MFLSELRSNPRDFGLTQAYSKLQSTEYVWIIKYLSNPCNSPKVLLVTSINHASSWCNIRSRWLHSFRTTWLRNNSYRAVNTGRNFIHRRSLWDYNTDWLIDWSWLIRLLLIWEFCASGFSVEGFLILAPVKRAREWKSSLNRKASISILIHAASTFNNIV